MANPHAASVESVAVGSVAGGKRLESADVAGGIARPPFCACGKKRLGHIFGPRMTMKCKDCGLEIPPDVTPRPERP